MRPARRGWKRAGCRGRESRSSRPRVATRGGTIEPTQGEDSMCELSRGPESAAIRPVASAIAETTGAMHYWPTSHRQNDAELCVAAHHARVSLVRLFEWICFNHGTHAG